MLNFFSKRLLIAKVEREVTTVDEIVSAYARVLEAGKSAVEDLALLPYSKEQIKAALKLDVLRMNDKQYTSVAGGCYVSLARFQPANIARVWENFSHAQALLDLDQIAATNESGLLAFAESNKEMQELTSDWAAYVDTHDLA